MAILLSFVTPFLQQFIPGLAGFNALAPGIVMGVMIVPMIASLSEDALQATPNALREAAYGLGAGRASTILRVVLPAARSGITAASPPGAGAGFGRDHDRLDRRRSAAEAHDGSALLPWRR